MSGRMTGSGTKAPGDKPRGMSQAEGDAFYAALMAAHDGLGFKESARLNARLVLLMADAIGYAETLQALIDKAKAGDGAS